MKPIFFYLINKIILLLQRDVLIYWDIVWVKTFFLLNKASDNLTKGLVTQKDQEVFHVGENPEYRWQLEYESLLQLTVNRLTQVL